MSRKNSMKIRKTRHQAAASRAEMQAKKLEDRKKRRAEKTKERMEQEPSTEQVLQPGEKKPLKRKAERRLKNEMARLARKGIKLVKADDDDNEVEMDDGDRPNKKMR